MFIKKATILLMLQLIVLVSVQKSYADLINEFKIEEIKRFADLIIRGIVLNKNEILIQDVYKGKYDETKVKVEDFEEYMCSEKEANGEKKVKIDDEVVLLLENCKGKWILSGRPTNSDDIKIGQVSSIKVIRNNEVYGFVTGKSYRIGGIKLSKDIWTPTYPELLDSFLAPDIIGRFQLTIKLSNSKSSQSQCVIGFKLTCARNIWYRGIDCLSSGNYSIVLMSCEGSSSVVHDIPKRSLQIDYRIAPKKMLEEGELYCSGHIVISDFLPNKIKNTKCELRLVYIFNFKDGSTQKLSSNTIYIDSVKSGKENLTESKPLSGEFEEIESEEAVPPGNEKPEKIDQKAEPVEQAFPWFLVAIVEAVIIAALALVVIKRGRK